MALTDFLMKRITRRSLDAFIASQASSRHVLDLGCGDARYARYFPDRVGFDRTPGPGVDVAGSAYELPFEDASFDLILCTEVLEHLETPHLALGEMYRVLAEGGELILTTRFLYPIHDGPYDYFRYTKHGLRYLLAGWEITTLRKETCAIDTFAILVQSLYRKGMWGGTIARALVLSLAFAIHLLHRALARLVPDTCSLDVLDGDDIDLTSGYYVIARKGSAQDTATEAAR